MIASGIAFLQIIVRLLTDLIGLFALSLRPRLSIEAENPFFRRELALYVERGIRPRRVDAATRLSLALLSRLFDWRDALVVVRPETMIRWHRAVCRVFWRFKSTPRRTRLWSCARLLRTLQMRIHLRGEVTFESHVLAAESRFRERRQWPITPHAVRRNEANGSLARQSRHPTLDRADDRKGSVTVIEPTRSRRAGT
jgi:hypothetical protein